VRGPPDLCDVAQIAAARASRGRAVNRCSQIATTAHAVDVATRRRVGGPPSRAHAAAATIAAASAYGRASRA
jgi:hypothetical protein